MSAPETEEGLRGERPVPAIDEPVGDAHPSARWWRGSFTSLRHDRPAFAAAIFLVLLVAAAIAGIWLAPAAERQTDLLARWLEPLSPGHLLGTDALGRDMFAQLLAGARLTLTIGLGVVFVSATVGTLLGLVAGYKGGRTEALIMRIADAQLAFPGLLVVLLVLAFLGASVPVIILVLATYGWMIYARVVRGQVLQLRETPAIQSAELVGCSTSRILFRHLLPNVYPLLLVQGMLEFARVIIAEASLSYLGLGIQPPDTSWGLMVAENQEYISTAWWTVVIPGAALTLTVLSLNLVANWLGQHTDPTQRQRRVAPGTRRRRAPELALDQQAAGVSNEIADPPLLSLRGLRVDFHTPGGRVTAVSDASFEIAPGETVGIVGESGSGKSTTALALMDLVPPPGRIERAAISWEGKPLTRARLGSLRGSDITMIFQDPMTSLNPLVRIGRQITESLTKHRGMSRSEAKARALELLELVGIPSPQARFDQFPYELSGGMRQRVMIAIALAPEPKLIIADEPTTALDATIQAQILELVAGLQEKLGIAMLLITHDLGVVARVCDRVVVMYGGRSIENAPIRSIFEDPRHRYTQALLGSAPSVDFSDRRLTVIPGSPPRGAIAEGCPFLPRCGHGNEDCRATPPMTSEQGRRNYACWHPAVSGRAQVSQAAGPERGSDEQS